MPADVHTRASRTSTALLALLALLVSLGLTQTAGMSAASAAAEKRLSGAYSGGVRAGEVAAFGAWRGRPSDVASDFLPGDSWTTVEGPAWFTGHWAAARIQRLVIGVPILPGAKGSTTLETGATGAYNAHYAKLASNLVAAGLEDSVLRLGWEMNGNWFPWTQIGHEAAFAEYWRQVVRTMRAVPGQRFAFEFNPTLGSGTSGARSDAAWPGDSYVDVIGLNVYDSLWGNSTATPEQRWSSQRNGTYGLDWWAAFAAQHGGKPLGFPEWGLWDTASQSGGGGGDNPYFIRSFLAWLDAHHVLYDTYFDVEAVDGNHRIADFPKAAAAYRAAFTQTAAPIASPAPVASPAAVKPTPAVTATTAAVKPTPPVAATPVPVAPASRPAAPPAPATSSTPTASPVSVAKAAPVVSAAAAPRSTVTSPAPVAMGPSTSTLVVMGPPTGVQQATGVRLHRKRLTSSQPLAVLRYAALRARFLR